MSKRTIEYAKRYNGIPVMFRKEVWKLASIHRGGMTLYKNGSKRFGPTKRAKIEESIEEVEELAKMYESLSFTTTTAIRVSYHAGFQLISYVELWESMRDTKGKHSQIIQLLHDLMDSLIEDEELYNKTVKDVFIKVAKEDRVKFMILLSKYLIANP